MSALTLLALARRFWPYLAGAAILICAYLYVFHRGAHSRDAEVARITLQAANSHNAFLLEKAAFAQTVSNFRRATAEAQAADAEHASRIERADATISRENQDALTKQRDAALAAADAHTRSVLDGAGGAAGYGAADGRSGSAMSAAAGATALPGGGGQAAVLASDNRICAEAVTKAEGWLGWWRDTAAVAGRE